MKAFWPAAKPAARATALRYSTAFSPTGPLTIRRAKAAPGTAPILVSSSANPSRYGLTRREYHERCDFRARLKLSSAEMGFVATLFRRLLCRIFGCRWRIVALSDRHDRMKGYHPLAGCLAQCKRVREHWFDDLPGPLPRKSTMKFPRLPRGEVTGS